MIKVKIVSKDSKKVAKVVIIDDDNRVLMLKRSNYVDKYAGEWDLPGGHIQVGEELSVGMRREVKEETGLEINNPIFVQKIENLDSSFYVVPLNLDTMIFCNKKKINFLNPFDFIENKLETNKNESRAYRISLF